LLSLLCFTAAAHDVLFWPHLAQYFYAVPIPPRVLHHDHCIGAPRDASASHDFDALSGSDLSFKEITRAHTRSALQRDRDASHIAASNRVSITSGAIEGRQVSICEQWIGKHAPSRRKQGNTLHRRLRLGSDRRLLLDRGACVFVAQNRIHGNIEAHAESAHGG
jgi:hypothetical protein